MNNLQEQYNALLADARSSAEPLARCFARYTPEVLATPEGWWKALAVCEHALDSNEDRSRTARFFEWIFSSFENAVECDLDSGDYDFWWEKVMQICRRVAEFDGAGWAEIGSRYANARSDRRDTSRLFEYTEKAASMGHPASQANVAYWLYIGAYCQADKEAACQRFDALASPEARRWGKLNRAYIAEMDNGPEEGIRLCRELIDELSGEDTDVRLLRACTYVALGEMLEGSSPEEAAESYRKALAQHPRIHALKNLGVLCFLHPEWGQPREQAFGLWEEAFRAGEWSAAGLLAYYYREPEWLDEGKAEEWIAKGALYDDSYCMYELALTLLDSAAPGDEARALGFLRRCAANGYVPALESLGYLYAKGERVAQDADRARQLLEQAVQAGSGRAAYSLGWMYEDGTLADDPARALECYEQAARLDDADGCCRAAVYWEEGYAGSKNLLKAKTGYERAAALGSVPAMRRLAGFYLSGTVVARNEKKAFELYRQAAESGDAESMLAAGHCWEAGAGTECRPEEAFRCYQAAADRGCTDGWYEMGRCHAQGIGVAADEHQAVACFVAGVEKENSLCLAEMGMRYEKGDGVEKDAAKALEYIRRAAGLGDGLAQLKLGDYCLLGFDTQQEDPAQALTWYTQAADCGLPAALLRLGDYYLYDYGQSGEKPKAFAYYREAASKGICNEGLGLCYELGIGTPQDAVEAFNAYRQAAEDGVPQAMYRLGLCYANGYGIVQNDKEARRWLRQAADAGSEAALKMLERS